MREDWRSGRRWHMFKSATQRYVLADSEKDCDWECWTDSFPEFCLQVLTRGIRECECWIDDNDFSREEVKKLSENLLDDSILARVPEEGAKEDVQSQEAQ